MPGGSSGGGVTYNDSLLYLMRDVLPNGLLGLAIAGLLAAFMAGMAANISAFNTVLSYDLWQTYVVKDKRPLLPGRRPDRHRGRDDHRDLHRRPGDQLREHHDLPADAVRLLQRAAVRDVHPRHVLEADDADRRLGRPGRRHRCPRSWSAFLTEDAFGSLSIGVIPVGGQGAAFLAASAAFVVDVVLSIVVSLVTKPKPVEELRGLVYSETPREQLVDAHEASYPWYRRTIPLAGVALVMVIVLNVAF